MIARAPRAPMEIAITGNGAGLHLLLGQAHRDASIIKIADAEFFVTELSARRDGAEDGRVSAKAVELVRCVSAKDNPGQAWNAEGLPPVGMQVHIVDPEGLLMYGLGESGEVVAHVEDTAVVRMSYGLGCFTARHLRTRMQIAAEERDAACRQMCIDAGGSVCDAQMAKAYMLYDQGYRKQSDA